MIVFFFPPFDLEISNQAKWKILKSKKLQQIAQARVGNILVLQKHGELPPQNRDRTKPKNWVASE